MEFYAMLSCPKCDSLIVYKKYIPEKRIYSWFGFGELKQIIPEYLQCRCGRCDYFWKDKTKEQSAYLNRNGGESYE